MWTVFVRSSINELPLCLALPPKMNHINAILEVVGQAVLVKACDLHGFERERAIH